MKKIVILCLLVLSASVLSSCGESAKSTSKDNHLKLNVQYISETLLTYPHEPTNKESFAYYKYHYIFTSASEGYFEIDYYRNVSEIYHYIGKLSFHYLVVDSSSIIITYGEWENKKMFNGDVEVEPGYGDFKAERSSDVFMTSENAIMSESGSVYYTKDYVNEMGYSEFLSDFYK